MSSRPLKAALLAATLLSADVAAAPLTALIADVETGPYRIFRNEGRYGEDGTWYDARDVGQHRNLYLGHRFAVELGLGERHRAIFLYAPFEVNTRVRLRDDLVFRNTRFEEDTVVDHRYLFEGYRGSYLFRALKRGPFQLELGGSLQIRNAEVAFSSGDGDRYVTENDIGLVPALKLRLRYDSPWQLYAMVEADGLSTFGLVGDVSGGLLDAALTLGLPVSDGADLFFRLRLYGGGAEVPQRDFENWAWFGAALIGLRADAVTLLDRL